MTNHRISEQSAAEFGTPHDNEMKSRNDNGISQETSQFKPSAVKQGGTFNSSEINPNVYSYGENANRYQYQAQNEDEELEVLTLNQQRTSI